LPVDGMNCHNPAARADDTACGCIALSTNGSSASSVGMPRFSISSTMWNRYRLARWVMRSK